MSRLTFSFLGFFFLFAALGLSEVEGQVLAGSPRQNEAGSFRVTPYLRDVKGEKLAFNVPAAAGTSNEVPGEVKGGWGGLKIGYQHGDDVEYFLQAGGGHYTLDVASSTLKNRLTGERVGWELAAGLKALIVPETPVTPAVSIAVSYGRSSSELNALTQSGLQSDAAQRLTLDRYDAMLWGSKKVLKVEPYAGVGWTKTRAKLKDLPTGSRNGGEKDSVRVLLGLRIPVFSKEAIVLEARVAGGTVLQAGWEIRFR